jgi:hypothetical protein
VIPIREQPVPVDVPEPLRAWLARFQMGVLTALRSLADATIADGARVEALTLTTGANTVSHRLGRRPRGWILTRQSVVLGLYETDAQQAQRDDRFLYLTATAGGVADLWVF